MILIPKDKPWPTETFLEKPSGIPIERRVYAKAIVMAGIHEWMRQNGTRPTHIIVPIRLKADFEQSLHWCDVMMMNPAWPESDDPEFLGMKLIFSTSKSLELLSNCP